MARGEADAPASIRFNNNCLVQRQEPGLPSQLMGLLGRLDSASLFNTLLCLRGLISRFTIPFSPFLSYDTYFTTCSRTLFL